MLGKGIPKTWKFIQQIIQKNVKSKQQFETKTCEDMIDKTKERAKRGSVPKGPGDTIRSKIEDKLTEEKQKDRETAAHPNRICLRQGSAPGP